MFQGAMSRRAQRESSKENKGVPVCIRYESVDDEKYVKAKPLKSGSSKERTPESTLPSPKPESNTSQQTFPVAKQEEGTSQEVTKDSASEIATPGDPGVLEVIACDENDLTDGEMREVDIGEAKVLLVRDNGEFHAIGAKCTHFAAPLVKGVLGNGHVRCPWHGACFNIRTGDIEDFPGLDSVPKFEVEAKEGRVVIRAEKEALANHKRVREMVCGEPAEDSSVTVIVGGGPSAVSCAETLRQEGYRGQICVLTKDRHLPYDRPRLSKLMNTTPDQAQLRDQDFYKTYDIELEMESEVVSVDVAGKTVQLKTDQTVKYDNLLLATGTIPRQLLSTPGHDLQNVCTLRTLDDAMFIAEQAKDKRVVIIGTSFIGVETAAYLADKAQSVTIVDLVEAPFQLALGKEVGSGVKKLLEEKGVQFFFKNSAKEFVGTPEGKVDGVILQDDTKIDADFCIVGIGVVPATDFLKSSQVTLTDRGFVPVDKQMRTSVPGVFAAGDITQFPLFMADDTNVNIQHWQMAHQQGRIAALNILNKDVDIKSVPFFWTVLFGKSIRYTGYGFGYDDIILSGDPEELKFIAYYTKGDSVVAVATMNEDPMAARMAEAFLSGAKLTKDQVRSSPTDWPAYL